MRPEDEASDRYDHSAFLVFMGLHGVSGPVLPLTCWMWALGRRYSAEKPPAPSCRPLLRRNPAGPSEDEDGVRVAE